MATTFYPYRTSDGLSLGLSFKGASPISEGTVHDFSIQAPAIPAFEIKADLSVSHAETGKVLCPAEKGKPPIEVVLRLFSPESRRREMVRMSKVGHSYTATFKVDPSSWKGDIDVDAAVVRSNTNLEAGVGFAADKGARMMYLADREVIRLAAKTPPRGKGLKVSWEDFSDAATGLSAYADQLFAVDDREEVPAILLNSALAPQVTHILELTSHGHLKAHVRNQVLSMIASNIISTLLIEALYEISKEQPPRLDGLPEWQQKLVEIAAPLIYRAEAPSDPTEKLLSDLCEPENLASLIRKKVPLAAQCMAKLGDYARRGLTETFTMPAEPLLVFDDDLTNREIIEHLMGVKLLTAKPTAYSADLVSLASKISHVTGKGGKRASWDVSLVEPVHKALCEVPRSVTLSPGFWSWLCMARFPQFVWDRWWSGKAPADLAAATSEQPAKWRRFGARNTMGGMSRNALSRLYWAGETLRSTAGEYALAQDLFRVQDVQQQVFDNLFGLVPAVARGFVAVCKGRTGKEVQTLGKRLNEYGSTIMFEYLEENDVVSLLG